MSAPISPLPLPPFQVGSPLRQSLTCGSHVFSAVFRYPGFIATWSLDYCNSYQTGWSVAFMGDNATMILDNLGSTVYAEPWSRDRAPVFQQKAVIPVDTHVRNFLECIASRREPNCPVEVAAQAVAGPHMANAAMLQG